MRMHVVAAVAATALWLITPAASAAVDGADVFNGRIAFSSFRVDQSPRTGDIFTFNSDGSDLRRLTTNPADDAQSDWSPDGRDIAYRIRKPASRVNYEVARMSASGTGVEPLTDTPTGQASSQPAWSPDGSAILFRRSGPALIAGIWRMGPHGEDPVLFQDPPGPQWYPSLSPDMSTLLFATTVSPSGDSDRAIQVMDTDGTGLVALFDVAGAYDSAPAWSADGRRIAFESSADIAGGNPELDLEIWVMDADGANPTQLTHNAIRDEGPAWSPDGTMLAYSSGADDLHLDINVMTAGGLHLRRLTDYEGRDESPDWQAIPAPQTDRRCGDLVATGSGARDVRAAGLSCRKARRLAARWSESRQPGGRRGRRGGFDATVEGFGGLLRVVLTEGRAREDDGDDQEDRLVAFLFQPDPPPAAVRVLRRGSRGSA
jgi:dipeptidyl aminopeptidase/acylaminoacyl peptidase